MGVHKQQAYVYFLYFISVSFFVPIFFFASLATLFLFICLLLMLLLVFISIFLHGIHADGTYISLLCHMCVRVQCTHVLRARHFSSCSCANVENVYNSIGKFMNSYIKWN